MQSWLSLRLTSLTDAPSLGLVTCLVVTQGTQRSSHSSPNWKGHWVQTPPPRPLPPAASGRARLTQVGAAHLCSAVLASTCSGRFPPTPGSWGTSPQVTMGNPSHEVWKSRGHISEGRREEQANPLCWGAPERGVVGLLGDAVFRHGWEPMVSE